MDINEVVRIKLKLEEDIRNLIVEFEKETKCTMEDIDYEKISPLGSGNHTILRVTTKILL